MSAAEEDRKPDKNNADAQPNYIELKVKGQDGGEVFFKIKRNAPLKK